MQTSARPKKRGNKGCLIAALIVLGLFFLCIVAVGVVIYRASQDPEVRKAWAAAQEGMQAVMEATNAPGTDEMRALGCNQAMVIDTARLNKVAGALEDEPSEGEAPVDATEPPEVFGPSPMLMCQLRRRTELTCEELVKAYVAAAPEAEEKMKVQIIEQGLGNNKVRCSGVYGRDGQFIEPLDDDSLDDLPIATPDELDDDLKPAE